MSKVVLNHIKKIYPSDNENNKKNRHHEGVLAVDDFNLEIEDNEFVVLVGPSGCGKSTTLRMIAGLEEITEGELYIGDKLVNNLEPKDRNIAMVFQDYALYPHMSVFDNMSFSLKLKKKSKDEIQQRVNNASHILDIIDYLDRKPKALSGGQRQRVAIGRSIVRDPSVFLMDEPLSNLDAKLRNQMRAEIIKLREKINTTFIYVTHDQTEAMTLGDRIVVMKDGIIQQVGKPQDLFDHPINIFVAGFIGRPQMNFMDAELLKDNSVYSIKVGNYLFVPDQEKQNLLIEKETDNTEIILGIRPEHFVLSDHGIPATIYLSELMGSSIHLHVKVDIAHLCLLHPFQFRIKRGKVMLQGGIYVKNLPIFELQQAFKALRFLRGNFFRGGLLLLVLGRSPRAPDHEYCHAKGG